MSLAWNFFTLSARVSYCNYYDYQKGQICHIKPQRNSTKFNVGKKFVNLVVQGRELRAAPAQALFKLCFALSARGIQLTYPRANTRGNGSPIYLAFIDGIVQTFGQNGTIKAILNEFGIPPNYCVSGWYFLRPDHPIFDEMATTWEKSSVNYLQMCGAIRD
ncbi:hypothetical protein niasHT_014500 [Heterodera trifolii]|uniref:Uncharacterized protein n=1 Tax=Heterodera trifolii TaxID=157864 RepID=A0ABD2KZL1_9BILA